jgi:glycosyltransferase involved in cell wall biosynthesis
MEQLLQTSKGEQASTTPEVDVAFLLEGTFPYVSGGVSSWVNQLILGFPELKFAIVFLGSSPEDYGDMKYKLPDNVVHFEKHYLHTSHTVPVIKQTKIDKNVFEKVINMHKGFRATSGCPRSDSFSSVMSEFSKNGKLYDQSTFLYSHESWNYIQESYENNCQDPSFLDYFWTVRVIHSPIWMLNQIAENLIPARVYHTACTGYAGLLGAMLKHKTGRPLVLSEHGIYTKERKIDLYQATWIRDNRNVFDREPGEVGYYKTMWINFFETIGRICYDASDEIVALFETNRQNQIKAGALAERTINIPNGINLSKFKAVRNSDRKEIPPILCLIARVVPIKDVKTFIRSIRTLVNILPNAEGWIVGPDDENKEYASECKDLVESLGLEDNIRFFGQQDITKILPQIGLIILSSISEALPLVILEGFAAGIPAVVTDVGSCRQLIYGLEGDDAQLGAAGMVVEIANPTALAHAAFKLLNDSEAWHQASEAGIKRVETYYTDTLMFSEYRSLYNRIF